MSFVFILVIIIFSCGIIYIVNAIRGIPLTYTKRDVVNTTASPIIFGEH